MMKSRFDKIIDSLLWKLQIAFEKMDDLIDRWKYSRLRARIKRLLYKTKNNLKIMKIRFRPERLARIFWGLFSK